MIKYDILSQIANMITLMTFSKQKFQSRKIQVDLCNRKGQRNGSTIKRREVLRKIEKRRILKEMQSKV